MRQKIYVLSKIKNEEVIPCKIYENRKSACRFFFLHSFFQKGKWSIKEISLPQPTLVVYIKRTSKIIDNKLIRLETYHIDPVPNPTFVKKVVKDDPFRVLIFYPFLVLLLLFLTIAYFTNQFHYPQARNICFLLAILFLTGMLFGEMVCLMKKAIPVKN